MHPAIPGRQPSGAGAFVLPTFAPCRHDEQLRRILGSVVRDGVSSLLLLRGESCTGKTRFSYEADTHRTACLEPPLPQDGPELEAAVAAVAVTPRTVIWLNDAQHLLLTDDERAAITLRHCLAPPAL